VRALFALAEAEAGSYSYKLKTIQYKDIGKCGTVNYVKEVKIKKSHGQMVTA
jgi:hypothetical protein